MQNVSVSAIVLSSQGSVPVCVTWEAETIAAIDVVERYAAICYVLITTNTYYDLYSESYAIEYVQLIKGDVN